MGVYALFKERYPWIKTQENLSLSRCTTVGCGGVASLSVSPSDAEEAAETLAFFQREKIPYAFLGAGANTLPPEGNFEAAILRSDMMKGLVLDGDMLFAGAGVTGGALIRFARLHGIGGFEPFVGIPMTVGGAITMNAGIREKHFSDVVLRVLAVRGGRIECFPREACGFGEKKSIFQSGIFVAGAILRAERADERQISQKIAEYLARRSALPKGKSMGCVFVNPKEVGAGELIDRCGLKGMRVGGAFVSERHANFIINEGGSADDVARLIEKVKAEVYKKSGVVLIEEIRRLTFLEHT